MSSSKGNTSTSGQRDAGEDDAMTEWWDRFGKKVPKKPVEHGFSIFGKEIREQLIAERGSAQRLTLGGPIVKPSRIKYWERWEALSTKEKVRYVTLASKDKDRYRQEVLPYQELEKAGRNGDLKTLQAVIAAYKQQESRGSDDRPLALGSILLYAMGQLKKKTLRWPVVQESDSPSAFAMYWLYSLHHAAQRGQIEACQLLLELHGSDVSKLWEEGRRMFGTNGGRHALRHPLVVATKKGNGDVVNMLLFSGSSAASSLVQCFWEACDSGTWNLLEEERAIKRDYSLSDSESSTAHDHDPNNINRGALLDVALSLLDYGAVPTDFGVLLQEAFFLRNSTEHLDKLQSYWTKVHPSGRDPKGQTLLHIVCQKPQAKASLIKTFLEHNPNDARVLDATEGFLPIHYACKCDLDLNVVFTMGRQMPETLWGFGGLPGSSLHDGSSFGKAQKTEPPTKKQKRT